jgi:peptidoglycan/xylan/chitin deacetylase (PgdA/CDA1 family)
LEVGAHTVNHIDLGTCSVEAAEGELVRCREELEKILAKPVEFFAFPFGRPKNIREETRRLIPAAGYRANFSANGGYIDSDTDPYEIPRGSAHYESSPIYCLLQIEGLTLSRIARKLKSRRSGAPKVAMQP